MGKNEGKNGGWVGGNGFYWGRGRGEGWRMEGGGGFGDGAFELLSAKGRKILMTHKKLKMGLILKIGYILFLG